MSIANFFGGLANGFSTYLALKQAAEEKNHQRLREGIEDQQRRDQLNLDYQREQNAERARDDENRRFQTTANLQAARDAGIVGLTPAMLDQSRNGNTTQSGTGAGYGGNVVGNALRSLQIAQSQPGFNPRQQVDLGNGLAYQGPEFGKEAPEHYSPVYGADNGVGAFNNETGKVTPTGFMGRSPVGSDPNNPRRYVVEHTPAGDFVIDKLNPQNGRQVIDPTTGQQAQGSLTIPGQPERDAASMLTSMDNALKGLRGSYEKLGYQSPGFISQEVMRHGGAAGNALVGAMDPNYQSLYGAQQYALNNLLYLKSGKVITDNEYQRLRTFLEPAAGDTKQTVQDKLARFEAELGAIKVRAGRAVAGGGSPVAPAGNNVQSQKADMWDALVDQGMDPNEATRQVNARFQGQ